MIVLGINAYHGDASAAIVVDGELVAAAEEERFNRIKHAAGLPHLAVRYCLEAAGARISDVDHVAISRDTKANLDKKLRFVLSHIPSARLLKDRIVNASKVRDLRTELATALGVSPAELSARHHAVEHHKAHIASAFLVSPFDQAACASIDGFGDFLSAMWGAGRGARFEAQANVGFPHSIGLFYTAVTQFLGFPNYGDEYKVMGLAPYGEPEFLDAFRTVLKQTNTGYELNLDYFLHHSKGLSMTWDQGAPTISRAFSDQFVRRFGPPRDPTAAIDVRHKNLAASAQRVVEEVYLTLLRRLQQATGLKQLCLAGGVAYNSVANGKIRRECGFDELFIQPAAGDAGTAIGAAFSVWHAVGGRERRFVMRHSGWGPEYRQAEIESVLRDLEPDLTAGGAHVTTVIDDAQLCEMTVDRLVAGCVVGWFQGRMEWGARALGHRSILADPRRQDMKAVINERIKRRESFRPFCPSILEEHTDEYFQDAHRDPFMLSVYPIHPGKRDSIPAVVHVDGTGRLQVVSDRTDPLYARLLRGFYQRTGIPVLLNTSFNENEPIVLTPAQAVNCFLRTSMDVLILGRCVIERPGKSV